MPDDPRRYCRMIAAQGKLALKLMQSLGIYDDFPQIPIPDTAEYAEKQAYLAGWLGEQRPLNVVEITSIYANVRKSIMAKTIAIGFSQTAQSQEVRAFMSSVVDLAANHIELWSSVHGGFILCAAMTYYGAGLATIMRHDLAPHFTACIARDAKVGAEGMNIMIKNHWFEQPAQAANRNALAK
jgi:hypothetical protein